MLKPVSEKVPKAILYIWRHSLIHFNKTRDRRVVELAKKYRLFLFVRSSKIIGEHVIKVVANIYVINDYFDNNLGLLIFYIKALFLIIKLNTKYHFDLIYSPLAEEPLGWILKKTLRISWVVDWWDNPELIETKSYSLKAIGVKFYLLVLKKMVRCIDALILGILPFAIRDYHIPDSKIILVTNGVNTLEFNSNPCPNKRNPDKSVLLYVGHLKKNRGVDTLLRAVAVLVESNVQVELWLIGFEDEQKWLSTAIHGYGLDKVVKTIGERPAPEIPEWINCADICIHPFPQKPGLEEIFPIKIYEYLACGKPVVSSDLPGVRSIIQDKVNGLFFRPDNPEDLAEKIKEIITDAELRPRLQKNARPSILQHDWNLILSKMFVDLEAIINKQ